MPAKTTDKPVLSISEIIEKVNKDSGEGTMVWGNQIRQVHPRLSTGSLSFDAMLGGGLVANQPNQVVGEFSSCKTVFGLQTIAYNQRIDPNFTTMWVAAEEWVGVWAEANGVDNSRVLLMESNVMETVYDAVLAALDSHALDLIVIDSLPALVPSSEDEKAMEEFTVGLGARINNKFFRKATKSTRRSLIEEERPCTLLLVNQWRENIGVQHGDNRVTPGGKGKDFHYFTSTELRRVEWIEQSKERYGMTVRARTHKNKIAPAQRLAEVDFYFAPMDGHSIGYDVAKDVMNTAMYYGIITRGGSTYRFGDDKWTGKEPVLGRIREDLDLQALLRREVMKVVHPGFVEPVPKKVNGTKKIAIKR